MLRLFARLVAAALVAAAAVVVLPTAPALAAYCGAGDGVSTVVDPGALGGGVSRQCGPGPSAAAAFADDHDLQDHPRQPGFICRIDGAPGDGDCLRNDAYWALFVSDDGGPWVYASAGADGQSVDDGDAVAFVWQSTSSRRSPGVAPPAAPAPTKAPTKQPSAKPTKKPTTTPTTKPGSRPSGPASADPTQPTKAPPSASATPTADAASPSASPSASASASASSSASPSTSAAAPSGTASSGDPVASPTDESDTPVSSSADSAADDGGVPLWLVLVMLALLLVATLAVLVHRRRTARSPGP